MNLPVVVVGSGGHAKVVIDALHRCERSIVAATDANPALHGTDLLGVHIEGDDSVLSAYPPAGAEIALGVGAAGPDPVAKTDNRLQLGRSLLQRGYRLVRVVHPSAVVADDVSIGEGTQVMAGAVVQSGTRIGALVIVNTRASIDHDCAIGEGTHIAPGAVLGGGVSIGEGSFIGIGAVVLPGLTIGRGCLIAGGAVVIESVASNGRVAGVPARKI